MTLLTADEIRSAVDIKTETIPVPEWRSDGEVIVRGLTAGERDAFEDSLRVTDRKGKTRSDTVNYRAKLAVLSCVDVNGKRVFTAKDVDWLTKKSAAALDRIVDVAHRLSGISKEDSDFLQNGSGPVPSCAITSDSPAASE